MIHHVLRPSPWCLLFDHSIPQLDCLQDTSIRCLPKYSFGMRAGNLGDASERKSNRVVVVVVVVVVGGGGGGGGAVAAAVLVFVLVACSSTIWLFCRDQWYVQSWTWSRSSSANVSDIDDQDAAMDTQHYPSTQQLGYIGLICFTTKNSKTLILNKHY